MRTKLSLLCLLVCMTLQAFDSIYIAPYRYDKKCAISYTFDDGLLEHYTMAAPELEKRGFRGTFWICGANIGRTDKRYTYLTWVQLKELTERGHEVSNHGWAHRNHGRFSMEEIKEDIRKNDSAIFVNTGIMPRTFCFPNNKKVPEFMSFVEEGRVGTRTKQRSIGSKATEENLRRWVEQLIATGDWGVGMTHGITHGYDAFRNPQLFWEHLDEVKRREDEIWVATFHDAVSYIKERDATRLNIKRKRNKTEITPRMTLDKELFTTPLTLVLKGDTNKRYLARQGDKELLVSRRGDKILLEINPSGDKIVVWERKKDNKPAPVIITAGQSNTDGRVSNEDLPDYIKQNKYTYCKWAYGTASQTVTGRFETFWPRMGHAQRPERWAYDAVTYYWLEQTLQNDFYVVKWSLGGTAIDTACSSTSGKYWSADPEWLAKNTSTATGGKSLLLSFTENIAACIDSTLSKLPQGYDVKAFLWHQGESDRHRGINYYHNLKAVVAYVRNFLVEKTGKKKYRKLPFICGTVARSNKQYNEEVEKALYRLAEEDKNFHVIDMADAELQRDQLHFTAASSEYLGKQMYDKIIELNLLK